MAAAALAQVEVEAFTVAAAPGLHAQHIQLPAVPVVPAALSQAAPVVPVAPLAVGPWMRIAGRMPVQ